MNMNRKSINTNIARTIIPLALLAALTGGAHAQSEKTREQVKAELAEAIRKGDVIAPGDSGLKLNELYPQRYPHATEGVAATRAQVKAEFAEAARTGELIAAGDSGLKLNELLPQRYPAPVAVAAGKTRAEVKAELAEAIRTGDMVAAGEGGLKLNEEFPQRYAKARARYAGAEVAPAMTTARTSR
jgi:hypothetical protein